MMQSQQIFSICGTWGVNRAVGEVGGGVKVTGWELGVVWSLEGSLWIPGAVGGLGWNCNFPEHSERRLTGGRGAYGSLIISYRYIRTHL